MTNAKKNNFLKKLVATFIIVGFTIFLILYTLFVTKNAPQASRVGLATATDVRIMDTTSEEKSPDKMWEIKLTYPQVAGLMDPQLEKTINTEIQTLVDTTVSEFKKEAKENSNALKDAPTVSGTNQLFISYVANRVDSSFVSLDFTISHYYMGMAHPDSKHATLTYSLHLKKELQIADLFESEANFSQALSDYAVKDLNLQLGPDQGMTFLIAQGASPSAQNFRTFNISSDDLILIFDPYQVAPYSAGTRHVSIPFVNLKLILNPDLNFVR